MASLSLDGLTFLVVEDEPLIAMALEDCGARGIGHLDNGGVGVLDGIV